MSLDSATVIRRMGVVSVQVAYQASAMATAPSPVMRPPAKSLYSGLGLAPPIWSDGRGEGVFPNLEVGSLDCGRGGSDSAYPKIEWEKNRGRAHVRSVNF